MLNSSAARMLIFMCIICHVTLVTSVEDYLTVRNISEAAKKCFQEETWPCDLPLKDFPWSYCRFESFLIESKMPALFPDDQKKDYKSFLAVLKQAKIYSLLGSCMGRGNRIVLLREMFGYFFGSMGSPPEEPTVEVIYTTFDGIPVRLYKPTATHAGLRAGIFYIHGGGWVFGSAAEMDGITRRMAVRGDFVVASVVYRLAPEYRFPFGFYDCLKAITYFLNNAAYFGVDNNRIAVSGDSSGGNLAASMSLKLGESKTRPRLKMQALIYPALQAVDFNTPSYQENACDPYLDRDWMITFWMWYAYGSMNTSILPLLRLNAHTTATTKGKLGKYVDISVLSAGVQATYDPSNIVVNGNDSLLPHLEYILTHRYVSPLLARSMADLPHTYMFTCSQDVLRDEGFMYVSRLRSAGVKVEHAHHQALHAFIDDLSVPYASKAADTMIDYLKAHL